MWDGRVVAVQRLRQWRGVKPVAKPSGVAITTRLRTTAEDERVLDLVAAHLGRLRRTDLAAVTRPVPLDPSLDGDAKRQARRDRLNDRKGRLTAQSSARWANAIIGGNDAQYRLARDAQHRHIIGLRAGSHHRQAAGPAHWRHPHSPRAHDAAQGEVAKGYPTQAERFAKQRRLQHLRTELARIQADRDANRVRVTAGGKRLARVRHSLDAAQLSLPEWRERWDCARYHIEANGSGDEPFGNLTITVTPGGDVSVRLPKPLEHLANAPRGRYILSGPAVFTHRGDEWVQRITNGNSVSYTLTRKPGRGGRYLTASWAIPSVPYRVGRDGGDVDANSYASGSVLGVDLNDGHLAVRRLDMHGNPVGALERIDIDLTGISARRDAQVRHAITGLLHYARRHGITTIAVEDLDFADARATGRETMGRGARGKRFRRTVSGIPTAVFRNRLTGMACAAGIELIAVNPAYSSIWGAQHWQRPYENVTRHQAAATVIRHRVQGYSARRRKGVTPQRPEDRAVRATNQTGPNSRQANTSSPPTRDTGNHMPRTHPERTRLPGRATATPATANNGQQHQ